jgi:hypothetical protein
MDSRSLKAALQSTKKKRSNSKLYRYLPAITLLYPAYLASLPQTGIITSGISLVHFVHSTAILSLHTYLCLVADLRSFWFHIVSSSLQFPYKHTNVRSQCYAISCGFITTTPSSLNLYLGNYAPISNDSPRWLCFSLKWCIISYIESCTSFAPHSSY